MVRILSIILLYVMAAHASDMMNAFWCEGRSCEYAHQYARPTVTKDSVAIKFEMDGKVLGLPFFGTRSKICMVVKAFDYRAYVITNEDGGNSLFMSYPEHAIYIFHWNTELPVEPSIVDLVTQNGHYFLFSKCETAYIRYELGKPDSNCTSPEK